MRVIFMGTPDFSVPALQALMKAGHDIVCVYTQPPRPAGRGKKEQPSPVHRAAQNAGLPVRHPVNFKTADDIAAFHALNADIAVVVAYGLLLPEPVLQAPRSGCLNIHASLLPRWRGAAPLHRAIIAGDDKTGVCIMQMEQGLDTGPVLLTRETPINADDTTEVLHDRLSDIGAQLIVQALENLDALTPCPQPDTGVTYAAKIEKAEARIDWSLSAMQIDRLIRGLAPFPGAWCEMNGERVKLLGSKVVSANALPGTVLDHHIIACGQDAVEITRLQRAGKQPMLINDALRGFSLPEKVN